MNPYALLNVARDATSDDIHKAYRRLAKTAHPDVGGDAEAWARLQQAYNVLMDETLRARYDEMGTIGAALVDNEHAEITGFIAAAIRELLARIEAERALVDRIDFVAALKQQIGMDQQCRHRQLDLMTAATKAMKGRFMVRDPAAEPVNRMEGLVRSMEGDVEAMAERCRVLDELSQKALVVLGAYEFRLDRYLPPQPRIYQAKPGDAWDIFAGYRRTT